MAAIVAGALAIAGVVHLGGGGDGSGSSGGTDPGDSASAGNAPQLSNSPAADGYRCPTSLRDLRTLPRDGFAIPSCKATILAGLPEGWNQYGKTLFTYPPGGKGFFRYSAIRFANFDLPRSAQNIIAPLHMDLPKGGVVVILQGAFPLRIAPGVTDVEVRDRLRVDGLDFKVKTRAEEPISDEVASEIESLLASLATVQKLCPCPSASPDP